ncbi:unnamed protein product [Prunus armeniaca]
MQESQRRRALLPIPIHAYRRSIQLVLSTGARCTAYIRLTIYTSFGNRMTNLYESTPLDLAMIALDARKPKIGQPSAPSRVAFGHPTSGKWCIVAIGIPMTS